MRYEYKVLPAPKAGLKGKGIKTAEDRFAHALSTAMNILGAEGWEYQCTDTLPVEQREGLMGKATVFQNMMVFRRALPEPDAAVIIPPVTAEPEDDTPEEVIADIEDAPIEEVAVETDDVDAMSSGRRLNLNSESM